MLERGRYGVEWTRPKPDDSSGLGRVVLVVVALTLVSLAWTVAKRVRARVAEKPAEPETVRVADAPAAPLPADPTFRPPAKSGNAPRSPKVRNLLMRLEEAERRRDVEMAVTTIELLRDLPGSPAADLDDALARRLGTLNFRRLFTLKSAQWVTSVKIGRRDSAERVAAEHGSTYASLLKLNGGKADALRPGKTVSVLNHPRFALIVRRRMRTADLQLNGKFFKRYDLVSSAPDRDGAYEVSLPFSAFWKSVGLGFRGADAAEIELLMPKGAAVVVSEI